MGTRPIIELVALGPVDPHILRHLKRALTRILATPVRLLPPRPLPLSTFHVVRNQYHSTQILEHLLETEAHNGNKILGVTGMDLFVPILTFVFGEAQLGGRAAVISLCRPRGDMGGLIPTKAVLLSRLVKLALHELGHTLALEHCRQSGCVMGFSSNLNQLDQKKPVFCEYCRVLLTDYFQEHGWRQHFKKSGEILSPSVPRSAVGNDRTRRR